MTGHAGFDREAAERRWRTALLASGGVTVSEARELLDHLEHVEAELLEQLPPEEAFWVAAHRVGTPEALTREFAKVRTSPGWLLRVQWVLLGLVLLEVLRPVAQLASTLVAALVGLVPGLEELAQLTLMVLVNSSYLLPALIGYLLVRHLRLQPDRLEGWLERLDLHRWRGFGLFVAALALWRFGLGALQSVVFTYGLSGVGSPLGFGVAVTISLLVSVLLPAVALVLVVRLQRWRTALR